MAKHNERNERIKRRYAQYLTEAKQLGETSVDQALAAIERFDAANKRKDFAKFHIEQAISFKDKLAKATSPTTNRPLSKATITHTLAALRKFFVWLSQQPGYKQRIRPADAEYFNPSNNDRRLARAGDERPFPSLSQVKHALASMPTSTPIERRNRGLVAFLSLSGMRDGAVIGLKLRHVDFANRRIRQDPREIHTKFAKSMMTDFFPVGLEVEEIVVGYVRFLSDELKFGPTDPLFPKTNLGLGTRGGFEQMGLSREHWRTAAPIRKIVGNAFTACGMPAFHPHGFRKTLVALGMERCRTPEALKAWSQNLGHEDVMTTLREYGKVSPDRQSQILHNLVDENT